jgi:hypothetical protein
VARTLKLQDEDHIIELEKPDGEKLRIEVVRATIENQGEIEKQERELSDKLEKKLIFSSEYYIGILSLIIKNFDYEDYKNFTLDQLSVITEEITKIRSIKPRTSEEKKTAES